MLINVSRRLQKTIDKRSAQEKMCQKTFDPPHPEGTSNISNILRDYRSKVSDWVLQLLSMQKYILKH